MPSRFPGTGGWRFWRICGWDRFIRIGIKGGTTRVEVGRTANDPSLMIFAIVTSVIQVSVIIVTGSKADVSSIWVIIDLSSICD